MCYLLTCQVCVSANLSNMLLHIIFGSAYLGQTKQCNTALHRALTLNRLFYQGNSNW